MQTPARPIEDDGEAAIYPLSMWSDEARSPYMAASLYLLAFALGLLSGLGNVKGWW